MTLVPTAADDIDAIESEGLPLDLPASTYEMIHRGAALDPSAPALSFFLTTDEHRNPQTWSYQQFLRDITRSANAFHELGASRDTVIAYVLPNLPETHFVVWGGEATGIVFAVNPMLEPAAIAKLLIAAGASIIVTLAPFPGTDLWSKVTTAVRDVPSVRHLIMVDLADRVRGLKSIAARFASMRERRKHRVHSAVPGVAVHDFTRLRAKQPADTLVSGRIIDPDDYSSYFCTGGTTGLPKIAMRRHRNEVANATSAQRMLPDGIKRGKNVFCGLPMFHVNAVTLTGLVPFSVGAHVVLGTPQGYRGEGVVSRFWELVQHHRIHFFSGVPTVFSTLLGTPSDDYDLSSLEYGICGAAPLPVETMRQFEDFTGVKILEGYGLTEGTCVSSTNPAHGQRRPGSIGIRIPFQDMKTVLLDGQGRYLRDCEPDEIGTIALSGPNIFAGYRTAEHNQGLWIDRHDGERWLNTGDLGRQDPDGYFWLTGRSKELIIRGGHNIDPAEIEQVLYQHADVRLAAAVGRPDARAGELPVAYVELVESAHPREQELLDFTNERITQRAAQPKAVHIIDKMPLTAVGKIFKPALSRREIEDALTDALIQAGVDNAAVRMDPDPSRPRSVIAALPPEADRAGAEKVLGSFPFAVTFTRS